MHDLASYNRIVFVAAHELVLEVFQALTSNTQIVKESIQKGWLALQTLLYLTQCVLYCNSVYLISDVVIGTFIYHFIWYSITKWEHMHMHFRDLSVNRILAIMTKYPGWGYSSTRSRNTASSHGNCARSGNTSSSWKLCTFRERS